MNLQFDIGSPEFKKEAYGIYQYLREHDPIHLITMNSGERAWIITKYEDAQETLKDNERFTKNIHSLQASGDYKPESTTRAMNFTNKQMLFMDPPDHTRVRSIVSKAFTPKMVESMEGNIQNLADQLIDDMIKKGHSELMNEYAFPLPIFVICDMLGIPQSDHHLFKNWSELFIQAASDKTKLPKVAHVMEEFADYVESLIKRTKNKPTNDLLSQMIYAQEQGDRLTPMELSSMVFILIVAGHETTVNLIGNSVYTLLEHPDQLKWLQEHPESIPLAIEELLRYRSPVEMTTRRWARYDFEWKGKEFKKGDLVYVSLASANRDPEQFDNPDILDLTRAKNKHISFGNGIHFCLGAPLARMEGRIAIETLIRRLPNIKPSVSLEELEWKEGILMRGLGELPITF